MLSISTSWNDYLKLDTKDWLNQVKELGINTIELGYTLSDTQFEEIVSLINVKILTGKYFIVSNDIVEVDNNYGTYVTCFGWNGDPYKVRKIYFHISLRLACLKYLKVKLQAS